MAFPRRYNQVSQGKLTGSTCPESTMAMLSGQGRMSLPCTVPASAATMGSTPLRHSWTLCTTTRLDGPLLEASPLDLRQRCLRPGQPEEHVHVAVQHDGGGQGRADL